MIPSGTLPSIDDLARPCRLWSMALAWLVSSLVACLPASALDPAKAFHQYQLDVWQAQEGMPQGSVLTILQTSDGYIWLGGYEDLVRFDGVRFTVFEKANTPAIRGNNIWALAEGPEHGLWIGTDGGGLARFKDGRFTTYTTRDGLVHDQVSSLSTGHDGSLWVGTRGGLTRLKSGSLVNYSTRDGLPHDVVHALKEDRHGSLWIGTEKGLSRLKDGRISTYTAADGISVQAISALGEDREGNLWIGTIGDTLWRFKDGTFTRVDVPGQEVRALHEDRDGNLWIGTYGGGLSRLHAGELTAYGMNDGLTSDVVWSLFEDREGSLWIGTEGGGVDRLRDSRFTPYTTRDGLPHQRVWAVYEDREGNLWLGTDGTGLAQVKGDKVITYTTRDGLAHDIVNTIHQRRDGSLWIGTNGGLNRWSGGRITAELTAEIGAPTAVYALYEDRHENLWIGTSRGGLLRLRDATVTTYSTSDGLPDNAVQALAEDRTGALWIGTDGGPARLRDGEITTYTGVEGLSGAFVRAIYEDAEGSVWIGTRGNGLTRIRDGEITTYTTADGLYNDVIYQLLEDGRQNLWMSCNKGIFRVSKKDLDDFARGAIPAIRSKVYGTADGMKSLECLGGTQPAGWKTRDGKLWFPTTQGLVIIDPEDLKTNKLPPPVHIERVLFDGAPVTPIKPGEKVTLPPATRELEFHYTGLSFLNPDEVRFKYQLVGYDEGWVDAGTRRSAYYTNMSPGDYRFRVIASNNDGVWNESGDSFELYVRPAFYQTWFFYVSCVLAAALLGLGIHRLLVRSLLRHNQELHNMKVQLEKKNAEVATQNAELERFAYTVSHDLKSPLFTIQGFLGLLEKDMARGDVRQTKADIRQIRTASSTMSQLLEELLELSRVGRVVNQLQEVSFTEMAHEAVELVAGRIAERGVEVVISPDLPVVFGDRLRLLEVLQNLIDNAVKFMGSQSKPRVEVGATREGEKILCYVRDNGIGIEPPYQEKVFGLFERLDTQTHGTGIGLALVKRIIEVHGGRIWAESAGQGQGSTFYFEIPQKGGGADQRPFTGDSSGQHPRHRGP